MISKMLRYDLNSPTYSPTSSFTSTCPSSNLHKSDGDFKVLMLHGFGQEGSFFRQLTSGLTHQITQQLYSNPDFQSSFPNGVTFLYPTGPLSLHTTTMNGAPCLNDPCYLTPGQKPCPSSWYLDQSASRHTDSLYFSIRFLRSYIEANGPIDGVIGFDQGAALATMLASWLEVTTSISRLTALALQYTPMTLSTPSNQSSGLKFCICISGLKLTSPSSSSSSSSSMEATGRGQYEGFYEPKIDTKTLVVMGVLDDFCGEALMQELLATLKEGELIVHEGEHEIPTETDSVTAIVEFVEQCVDDWENREEQKREVEMAMSDMAVSRRGSVASVMTDMSGSSGKKQKRSR